MRTPTETPCPMATRVLPAGFAWDAVRVPRFMGLAARYRIQTGTGPVIVGPRERASWTTPGTRGLGTAQLLFVLPVAQADHLVAVLNAVAGERTEELRP